MSPRISVVIRCFNEEHHIGRLLEGIGHQTAAAPEIIVVDSGSTDGTREIASRYPIRLLSIPPEEFSFGRSLNIGCRAASGEIIVIASAHTYPVYDDWLAQLAAPFADPQVALVYGRQRGIETTKYSERQIFARWFPPVSDGDQRHPFCNNANAAIRRAAWAQMPYDETLTGLEDLDWATRILARGLRIVYASGAEVAHVHHETWRQVFTRYRREAIALRRIAPQERFELWDFLRLFPTNVVSDYYHAAQDGVLWTNLWEIPAFRLMQFWGTYRGFAHRGPLTSALKDRFYYPSGRRRGPRPEPHNGRAIDYDRITRKDSAG